MEREADPVCAQFGLQGQRGNQVIAAVLTAVGNGRCLHRMVQPRAERAQGCVVPRRVHRAAFEHDEWRQHIETRIEQNAVLDRKQQIVDRPVDAAFAVMFGPAAGGHHQHGPLALEHAFAITLAPALLRMFADAIGEAVRIDALEPALHDRRHRKPPQRKLEDHQIRPAQFLLLGRDVRGLGVLREGALGVGAWAERLSRVALRKIIGVETGLPAHGVEIAYFDGVPRADKSIDDEIADRTVQRPRFRVGVYQQDIHDGASFC